MKKFLACLLFLVMVLSITFSVHAAIDEDTGEYYENPEWTYKDLYGDDGTTYLGYEEYCDGVLYQRYDAITEQRSYYDSEGEMTYYEGPTYDSDGAYTGYEGYNAKTNQLEYKSVTDSDNQVSTSCWYSDGTPMGVTISAETENGWQYVHYDNQGHIANGHGWDYETGEYYFYDPEAGAWLDSYGNEVSAADLGEYFRSASGLMSAASTWFSNNTVGVAGVALKTLNPDLTDKWYNVVPVDLSQDGTQVFPLVAGNHYLFGSVKVTVAGDEVTATYSYPDHFSYDIFPGDECLAWFTGVDQITSEFLDAPASETAFGTAVSKANDLNGQDTALLFVCNHVSYRLPLNNQGASLREYHPNTPGMAGYFDNATALMEKLGN